MDLIIYFCAVILPWVIVFSTVIIYFLFRKNKKAWSKIYNLISFLDASLSVLIAWFFVSLVKYNFYNPRPFEKLGNVKPLFIPAYGDSFPSAHAAFFGALAVAVFLYNKKFGLILMLGAIVVSIARVLAGVHWPVDVIVGLVFGGAVSLMVNFAIKDLRKRLGH